MDLRNDNPTQYTAKVETENKGWECPRCGSVNAPQIEQCKCVKTEDKDQDKRQLLTE